MVDVLQEAVALVEAVVVKHHRLALFNLFSRNSEHDDIHTAGFGPCCIITDLKTVITRPFMEAFISD